METVKSLLSVLRTPYPRLQPDQPLRQWHPAQLIRPLAIRLIAFWEALTVATYRLRLAFRRDQDQDPSTLLVWPVPLRLSNYGQLPWVPSPRSSDSWLGWPYGPRSSGGYNELS